MEIAQLGISRNRPATYEQSSQQRKTDALHPSDCDAPVYIDPEHLLTRLFWEKR